VELLEREGVLTGLSDHLASASRGAGRLVLLRGEAGVGKTTVLDAFAGRARSVADVLVGFCDPLSTPRPLGPLIDMAPRLGVRVQQEPDLSGVCSAVLAALDVGRPKVLIFEDIHWADEATLNLLNVLARWIERRAVLVVASFRDEVIGSTRPLQAMLGHLAGVHAVHHLVVEPFTPDGVARMAAGRRFDIDELYRITGGNPFFVAEVLAAGGDGIPATVGDVIAGRLSSMSPAARRTAEVVAVIGSPAPLPVVTAIVDGAGPAVAELLGAGLLRSMDAGVGSGDPSGRPRVVGGQRVVGTPRRRGGGHRGGAGVRTAGGGAGCGIGGASGGGSPLRPGAALRVVAAAGSAGDAAGRAGRCRVPGRPATRGDDGHAAGDRAAAGSGRPSAGERRSAVVVLGAVALGSMHRGP